jgi:hypothetical protein
VFALTTFDYGLTVKITPEVPKAGQPVEVTVEISNATVNVEYVQASVAEYGLTVRLLRSTDNTFTARAYVPWEAEPGRYLVTFWGVNMSGQSGPHIEFPVTVQS